MADSKISALPSGSPALGTDETIIARGSDNYKLTIAQVTGYLGTPVSVVNGGTGASTLAGVLKGNGTSAFTAATAGTDYAKPDTVSTWSAIQTFGSGFFKLTGATSGTLTINATAIAGTNTLTLPAATDTVAVVGTAQTFIAL